MGNSKASGRVRAIAAKTSVAQGSIDLQFLSEDNHVLGVWKEVTLVPIRQEQTLEVQAGLGYNFFTPVWKLAAPLVLSQEKPASILLVALDLGRLKSAI